MTKNIVGSNGGAGIQITAGATIIGVNNRDLRDFTNAHPLHDKNGRATLWETVVYDHVTQRELWPKLTSIYSLLKTGDLQAVPHLYVERVDFCQFGNSKPFRIRVVNEYNDNYDHFYLKVADASRVYG